MKRAAHFGLVSMAMLAMCLFASADSITGIVYQNIPDASNAADTANMGGSLAQASFVVGPSGINFQIDDSDATPLSTFLNNPTFTNPLNGFDSNGMTDNTELVLTGGVYLAAGNNSFIVAHDDGVSLSIAGFGNVLYDPGPTGEAFTPFNVYNGGAAGNYTFTLDYAECCGGPADLVFAVNEQNVGETPEPASMALMGTGLLLLLGFAVKQRRAASC